MSSTQRDKDHVRVRRGGSRRRTVCLIACQVRFGPAAPLRVAEAFLHDSRVNALLQPSGSLCQRSRETITRSPPSRGYRANAYVRGGSSSSGSLESLPFSSAGVRSCSGSDRSHGRGREFKSRIAHVVPLGIAAYLRSPAAGLMARIWRGILGDSLSSDSRHGGCGQACRSGVHRRPLQ